MLREMLPQSAVVGTDIPWAVGWYGQRLGVWLPLEPPQMATLNKRLSVDYVLLTPAVLSADWADTIWPHIFRGSLNLQGYRRVVLGGELGSLALFAKEEPRGQVQDLETPEK